MRVVPLSRGYQAVVDDEDYERVMRHSWHACENKYIFYATSYEVGKLSHFILGVEGVIVDHRNGDTLDNRRENLRIATEGQSVMNRGLFSNSTSGYKGVSWDKKSKCWRAYINVDKKRKHLGMFESPEKAALAYNKAALRYHGEFARLNEIKS